MQNKNREGKRRGKKEGERDGERGRNEERKEERNHWACIVEIQSRPLPENDITSTERRLTGNLEHSLAKSNFPTNVLSSYPNDPPLPSKKKKKALIFLDLESEESGQWCWWMYYMPSKILYQNSLLVGDLFNSQKRRNIFLVVLCFLSFVSETLASWICRTRWSVPGFIGSYTGGWDFSAWCNRKLGG